MIAGVPAPEAQRVRKLNKEQFIKILKMKNFDQDPEVVRAIEVMKIFQMNFPVIQTFLTENNIEINIKLKYPCVFLTYPFKLADSNVPILLYNTFFFKPL